jgi:hypothetical protein
MEPGEVGLWVIYGLLALLALLAAYMLLIVVAEKIGLPVPRWMRPAPPKPKEPERVRFLGTGPDLMILIAGVLILVAIFGPMIIRLFR